MIHPEAYLDFFVYEDGRTLIGVADVALPDIAFMSASLTGAGVGGTVDTPLAGMLEAMTLTLNFKSVTDSAVDLASPKKHNITIMAAGQDWDTVDVDKVIWADRYELVVFPKNMKGGTIAPAAQSDASGEYAVYYFAGYKDDEKRFEIDQFNQICNINGVDHMAAVRRALGRA